MEFAAIDFETTGWEAGCANEPWQLGFALVRDGALVETREWYFRVDRGLPAGLPAYARERALAAETSLVESFEDWSAALLGRRLVAHNISTERTILMRTAPLTKWGPWTDTLKVAKARYPGLPTYALGDLSTLFGCVPELPGRTWHDGLFDAVACALVALRLGA